MFTLGAVLGPINAGSLRPFAVMTGTRSEVAPTLPTVAEAGLPGVQANLRFVLMAPKGTAPEVVRTLQAAVAEVSKEPELRDRLQRQGFELLAPSPEETAKTLRQEHDRWGPLLKAANIRLD